MRITVYYNKNLKMSEGKLAAQVGHVCRKSGIFSATISNEIVKTYEDTIIVLGLRQNKFYEKLDELAYQQINDLFVQKDLGLTEVDEGTITAFGYIE